MPWSCKKQSGRNKKGKKTNYVRVKGKGGRGKVVSHHSTIEKCKVAVAAAEAAYRKQKTEDIDYIADIITDDPDVYNQQ